MDGHHEPAHGCDLWFQRHQLHRVPPHHHGGGPSLWTRQRTGLLLLGPGYLLRNRTRKVPMKALPPVLCALGLSVLMLAAAPPPGSVKGLAQVLAWAPQSARDAYADAGF